MKTRELKIKEIFNHDANIKYGNDDQIIGRHYLKKQLKDMDNECLDNLLYDFNEGN